MALMPDFRGQTSCAVNWSVTARQSLLYRHDGQSGHTTRAVSAGTGHNIMPQRSVKERNVSLRLCETMMYDWEQRFSLNHLLQPLDYSNKSLRQHLEIIELCYMPCVYGQFGFLFS